MKYDIFISYRREGGRDFARQVELALKSHGYQKIFFDYNSIRNGVFNTQIIDAINGCKDFILILSEGSMERCVNEDDWVAKEIRTAISVGCNIIPLTIGSFVDFPEEFPKDMRVLRNIQRSQLMTDEYFNDSINHIVDRLESKIESVHPQTSNSAIGIQQYYLKLKTNEDCNVFIDGEDRGIAEVDKITKFPLAKGEYSLSCDSRKSNRKLDLDDIVIIDGDVVRKVLFNQDTNIKFTTPRNEYSASNISQQKQDKDKSSKVTLDVKLLSVVQSETRINRAISALESCGYNHEDARIIVSCVPYTIKNKSEKEALKIKEALQDAGASVELKYANAEEGKYYDVILTSTGNIIEAIKALNEHCQIDVQKAKEMINNLPAIIPTDSALTLYSADLLKRKLEKAGVTILIKEQGYIDLGLPSRLKWATCNIGAIKPEGCGEYFAWGEIQSKKTYAESNSYTLRKSLSQLQNDGIVNSKGVLTSKFDAATKIRGNKWRMPTKEDFEELLKHCNWTKTTLNGVRGYTVSSKTNANSIFIPITGFYRGSSLTAKDQASYWSSSMSTEHSNHSYFLYSQENPFTHTSFRSYGCPIRPVMK